MTDYWVTDVAALQQLMAKLSAVLVQAHNSAAYTHLPLPFIFALFVLMTTW